MAFMVMGNLPMKCALFKGRAVSPFPANVSRGRKFRPERKPYFGFEFRSISSRTRQGRRLMKQDPIDERAQSEALPTEAERNYGMLTAGVLALVAIGTAVYWMS